MEHLDTNSPTYPTRYADVNTVLHNFADRIQAILGPHFYGMYLYGSLALGDFDLHTSDIDFIVITTTELSKDLIQSLQTLHDHFNVSNLPWANKIEAAYIPLATLNHTSPTSTRYPQFEKGTSLLMEPLESGWIFQLYTLREHGIPIIGPTPRTLIAPLNPSDIRRSVSPILNTWLNDEQNDPTWLDWLRPQKHQSFVVLTLCRLFFTLATATVASKPAAARWAQSNLAQHWSPLIERSLTEQHSNENAPQNDIDSTLAFLHYTATQCSSSLASLPQTFSFGPLQTSWLIVDGDGTTPYTPDTIHTTYTAEFVTLPPELVARRTYITQREAHKHQQNQPCMWNDEKVCLASFSLQPLTLHFKRSDYFTFQATNMSLDEPQLYIKYIQNQTWSQPVPYFSNSFGLSLLIITQDNQAIFTKRSPLAGSRPNTYNISLSEGMSNTEDQTTHANPDVYHCVIRGLEEELNLIAHQDFQPKHIKLLSFGVDTHYAQWGLLGMLKIDHTAAEITTIHSTNAKDAWENQTIDFIPWQPDQVVSYVYSHTPWAPQGLTCIYHALIQDFTKTDVDKAIQAFTNKTEE